MRGIRWVLVVATALLAGVLGAAVAAAVGYWLLDERDLSDAALVGGVAAVAGAAGATGAAVLGRRRTDAAAAAGGPYEVALRCVAGATDVAGRRWVQAVVTVDAGTLRVQRLVLGLRPLRRRAVEVEVLSVRDTGRRTPVRALLVLTPGMPVLELHVPGATLELATLPALAEALHAHLDGSTRTR